jgi:hypothetical protein
VFRSDIVDAHAPRFADRQIKHPFGPRAQRKIDGLQDGIVPSRRLLYAFPERFLYPPRAFRATGTQPLALGEDSEQEMLRPDNIVTQPESFTMRQLHNFFSAFSEKLPHSRFLSSSRIPPAIRSRERQASEHAFQQFRLQRIPL